MTNVCRGEVWRWASQDGQESSRALVISCDDWNRKKVLNVIVLEIVDGHVDEGGYALNLNVDGNDFTLFVDSLFGADVSDLIECEYTLDPEAMTAVDDLLDRSLAPTVPTAISAPTGSRAPHAPYPGDIRFAELFIPGEGAKPVVIVSSETYASELGYDLFIVCRKTSNPAPARQFEVPLSQGGKVVCSDVRTVSRHDLVTRTTNEHAVTRRERVAVLEATRTMLGLPVAQVSQAGMEAEAV